jgi:hypothetical protein
LIVNAEARRLSFFDRRDIGINEIADYSQNRSERSLSRKRKQFAQSTKAPLDWKQTASAIFKLHDLDHGLLAAVTGAFLKHHHLLRTS